jgi:hypothetical protein
VYTALLERVCSCTVISTFVFQYSACRVIATYLGTLQTLGSSVGRLLMKLTPYCYAHAPSAKSDGRVANSLCLFIPPSPHFVYHNLFMGGRASAVILRGIARRPCPCIAGIRPQSNDWTELHIIAVRSHACASSCLECTCVHVWLWKPWQAEWQDSRCYVARAGVRRDWHG